MDVGEVKNVRWVVSKVTEGNEAVRVSDLGQETVKAGDEVILEYKEV